MIIRKAKAQDLDWMVAAQVSMAMETEQLHLDIEVVKKGMQHVLSKPDIGHYWIAEEEGQLLGMMMILFEWSDWRCGQVQWIHSVYVSPDARKMGVFANLYKNVKEEVLKSEDLKGLRLFVDKTNLKAIEVYEKMGMTAEHYHLYEWLK